MKFSDIPYHDDVKQRLRDMVNGARIPHALMLEGPAGAGKMMLARALAQYIHCENRSAAGDSCGSCPACRQNEAFSHIDTFWSFPVIKKGKSGLSDDWLSSFFDFMRDNPFMDMTKWQASLDNINAQPTIYVEEAAELARKLSFTARQSRYKVAILWLPERLQQAAANKLLKIIEEPSDDTIFVLVSNNSKAVLPTIFSRTQRIRVNRYTDEQIASLPQLAAVDDASIIARLAQGNANTALELMSVSKMRRKFMDLFIELMRKAYQRKIVLLRQWSTDVADMGREGMMQFYDYCSRMIRENFIANIANDSLLCMTADEAAFASRFAPFVNERNVMEMFDMFSKARNDIAANGNGKIIAFDIAIKAILLLKR